MPEGLTEFVGVDALIDPPHAPISHRTRPPFKGGIKGGCVQALRNAYQVDGVCTGRVTRPLWLLPHLNLHRRGRVHRPLQMEA